MYKDQDKQREANRKAAKRYRMNRKGMTQGMTYCEHKPESVIPLSDIPVIPKQRTQPVLCNEPEPQSYNPMMVGYVPPQASDKALSRTSSTKGASL